MHITNRWLHVFASLYFALPSLKDTDSVTLPGYSVHAVNSEHAAVPAELPEVPASLVEDAKKKLDSLSADALRELKSFRNPPEIVKDVMVVTLTLLGQENTDWRHAIFHLSHHRELLRRLKNLPTVVLRGHAPVENFERARALLQRFSDQSDGLDEWPRRVAGVSSAASGLASFCVQLVELYDLLYLRPAIESPVPEQSMQHTEPELPAAVSAAEKAVQEEVGIQALWDMGMFATPPPLVEEVMCVTLILLGQPQTDWRSARQCLRHPKQLVEAMHTLGLMIAENNAPSTNFSEAAGYNAKWTSPSKEEFLEKVSAQSHGAKLMCAWCMELTTYWQSLQ